MTKINILPKEIYNRIAAGEVVDRPYSAVKELIENSIDAGATEIDIYIEKGGKQLIKVEDNGCGIERDDLKSAFLPHATSKISHVDDLDAIETLGFRGEALASISCISNVEIVSVTEGNSAYKITCSAGVTGEIQPAAREKGTAISVRDLFFNTPVRAKFLKNDKKEENDITSFVIRFILCHPEISFRYYIDGMLNLQSHGDGIDAAVAEVYGAKTLDNCYKIDATKEGIRIFGFIGNQNFFKSNKSYQSIFLNGRYIVNSTIATAINNAYSGFAMKRQFPFYVLNITVPPETVDVNVHPNKADVRFIDTRIIFGVIYNVISAVLCGLSQAADFVFTKTKVASVQSTMEDIEKDTQQSEKKALPDVEKYLPVNKVTDESELPFTSTAKPQEKREQTEIKPKFFDPQKDFTLAEYFGVAGKTKESEPIYVSDEYDFNTVFTKPEESVQTEKAEIQQQSFDLASYKYKGNLFNTYLIYEYKDKIYFIDQHAAHERLIFNKLIEEIKNRKIIKQSTITPYVFSVSVEEEEFLQQNIEIIRDIGFDLAPFGMRAYRIDAVPVDLQNIDVRKFFAELLSELDNLNGIKLEDVLREKIATTACKHAVKGGNVLTEQEIDALFALLNGNLGLKCPHGRPICVELSKYQIEKMFKRIV